MPDLLDRVFTDERAYKIVREVPPPEGQGDLLDRVFAEPMAADTSYSFDDPAEYEKQLRETLDMADELELSIAEAEDNYKNLTEKPDRKPMAKIPVGYTGIRAAPEPTKWEKFKKFFIGDRPPLPPDADRIEKVTRAFDIGVSLPLRTFLKFSKGMTLGAPDIMWAAIKRITPDDMWVDEVKDMTLDEAMDWAGGYDPSGFQKTVGDIAEFIGRIRTVSPIARKLGIIGKTPKDITVLGKAFESAKLFGTAAVGEQAAKFAAAKIDPTETEYGYEGPKAVLRDMAIGAAFSLVHSGVKGAWSKLTPTETQRALKLLGLKKGATTDEIRAAARNMARKYHPDKVKGFREEFENVIKARDVAIKGDAQDIVFRGQKVEFKPKLLPGETVKQQAIRLAEPAKGPKVTKLKAQIAEEEAAQARHLAAIAKEGKKPVKPAAEPLKPTEQAPTAAKQPWEMTGKEFNQIRKIRIKPDKAWLDKEPHKDIRMGFIRSEMNQNIKYTAGEFSKLNIEAVDKKGRHMPFTAAMGIEDLNFYDLEGSGEFEGHIDIINYVNKVLTDKGYTILDTRKSHIEQAVKEGKPVPRAVLEEYKSEPWAKEVLEKVPVEAKQPWEMTREEFRTGGWRQTFPGAVEVEEKTGRPAETEMRRTVDISHRIQVENALEAGQPVPREVLEEYKSEPWAQEALAKAGVEGEVFFHGTEETFEAGEIEEGRGNLRQGIYLSGSEETAKTYGKNIHKYTLSPDAKVLDLSDGESTLNFILEEGILEKEDIDVDLENYILEGRIFQADPFNRQGVIDDIMATAKDKGFDVVRLFDDLGGESDNIATVVLNKEVLKLTPTPPTKAGVEGEVDVVKGLPIIVKASDIDFNRAERAYAGISFTPEKRAKQTQNDYIDDMESLYEEMKPLAKSDNQKEILTEELERYKQGYIKKMNSLLDAKSRTMSTMITGPANFPVARNQKRQATEDKRREEFLDWREKAKSSIRNKLYGQAIEDAGGPLVVLEKELAAAEKRQETMKAVNVIVRKKIPDAEKIKQITADTDLSEATARKLLETAIEDGKPFEGFELTNNRAKIKRMQQRLATMKIAESRSGIKKIGKFKGGEIFNNFDAERVQIVFDEKPNEAIRKALKSRGFRWSPKNNAWQRKNTNNALAATKQVILENFEGLERIEIKPTVEVEVPAPPAKAGVEKAVKKPLGKARKVTLPYNYRKDFEKFFTFMTVEEEKGLPPLVRQWKERLVGKAGKEPIYSSGQAYQTTITPQMHTALTEWANDMLIEHKTEKENSATRSAKSILKWLDKNKPKIEKKKPPTEGGKRLMFGFDPGIDQFVAQSIKPAVINAVKAVKALAKFAAGVPGFSTKVFLQPSLELEKKSPEAYVAVMKAIHTAQDAAKLDFQTMPVEALDMNIEQIRRYFDKFTKEEQYDFMVSFAGQPGTPTAALLQKEAFDRLPAELQDPKVLKAVREIADKNFDYLVDVVGPNVGLVPDYFYGVFKSRATVDKFWAHWTSTDKFTKKKLIPSVADAINYGLESGTEIKPRHDNYIDNLMAEYLGIARLDQMQQLKAELMKTGSAGTVKPPKKVPEGKKKGTVIERRAAKLAEVYGSAKEALKLQELENKVSGVEELTQQQEAVLTALKKLVAEEKAADVAIDLPPADESLDSLREKSEAQDPDVNVIHPEDVHFYITEDPEMAPAGWGSVADPVFRGAWLRPDLARLINNLTATNKITRDAILNPIRQFNNTSRIISFFLSGFHLKNVTGAAVADSGFGGPLLHPIRALKPFRNWPSTKNWKKIQQTPAYKRLLRVGAGLGYSFEEDASKTFEIFLDYVNKNNMLGATGKLIETGLRIPQQFQKWQFDIYIPMLKHQANLDAWAAFEKKTGKPATDADLIDIIKATQNIYGEMNERVLGRSATQTTGSRFLMKAPGYAEGNTRTNIDAGTKWKGDRGYTRGWRARTQIVNSLLVKRIITIAGTLWLTGKLPIWPERKEDIPDLFKIDTGQVDGRGRRIMINTLDSDKDYLDLWFNIFILRPDEAIYDSFNRLGGMKSILAEFVYDGFTSMMGQKIRDWKGDPVFSLSDTVPQKLWKYMVISLERQQPISTSVFQQMRYKEISMIQSFLGALAGVRPTWSEYDKRESEFLRMIYEQKGDLEVLDTVILGVSNPRRAYENYNKAVDRILDAKLLPDGFKERYGPELYRDVDEYLQNKAEAASRWATTDKDKATTERAVKILKHFGIKAEEAVKLRDQRKKRMAKKAFERKYSKTAEELIKEQIEKKSSIANILRDKRLKERMKSK